MNTTIIWIICLVFGLVIGYEIGKIVATEKLKSIVNDLFQSFSKSVDEAKAKQEEERRRKLEELNMIFTNMEKIIEQRKVMEESNKEKKREESE